MRDGARCDELTDAGLTDAGLTDAGLTETELTDVVIDGA